MPRALTAPLLATLLAAPALASPPQYTIVDLGILAGDSNVQGVHVSRDGVYATGRSLASRSARAFSWTAAGGIVGLPNLTTPARSYGVGNGVANDGVVGGTSATTAFGSSPLPTLWQNGAPTVLPLPGGQTMGRVYAMNNDHVCVGSVNSGTAERGAIFTAGGSTVISAVTDNGSYLTAAFGINDSGRIVGNGIDPANAALNVGFVYDSASGVAFSVGALPGLNSALCFGVSNAGHVVGSSMLFQGSGLPFIWSDADGMVAIPLPVGTSQGSAKGVNSSGWAVGTASSAFAIPFLYDGVDTYRLADLLPPGSGWDLSTNTSSSALGISDNGVIVGAGMLGGVVRGYAMIPVACIADFNGDGFVDFFDYDDFVNCFETGSCAPGHTADANGDGFVDFFDYDTFVVAYEAGC